MSTEASVEGLKLPPWPDPIKRGNSQYVYKGALYTAYDDGASARTAQAEDEIAALRARLALAVNDLEEMSAALEEKGLHRTAQRLKQTALTCKEPSHG